MRLTNEHAMILEMLAVPADAADFRRRYSASAEVLDAMLAAGLLAEVDGTLRRTDAGEAERVAFDSARWEKWADRRLAKEQAKAPLLAAGGLIERPDPEAARASREADFQRRERADAERRAQGERDRLALAVQHGEEPIARLAAYYTRTYPADYLPGCWEALTAGRKTVADELARLEEVEAGGRFAERVRRGEAKIEDAPRAACNRCGREMLAPGGVFLARTCCWCRKGTMAYPPLPPMACEITEPARPAQTELF